MELLRIKPERSPHTSRWITVMFTGATLKDVESVKQAMAQYWGELSIELNNGEIQLIENSEGAMLATWDSNGILTIFSN